jgi:hypothetical protein
MGKSHALQRILKGLIQKGKNFIQSLIQEPDKEKLQGENNIPTVFLQLGK